MTIREILEKDIDAILELNERFVEVLSPLDANKLARLMKISALSVVLEQDNQVAGFLIAFVDGSEYDSINYAWFNEAYDSFLYVDRVVVSEVFQGQGVASKLYQYALDAAIECSKPRIVAEIDVMPPNEASLLFHKKRGFKEVELLKHNENKCVSLQELRVS